VVLGFGKVRAVPILEDGVSNPIICIYLMGVCPGGGREKFNRVLYCLSKSFP
jgi:hypothetical protein